MKYNNFKGYKAIILKLLDEDSRWFYSHELEKVSTKYGWIGLRGSRDCRELAKKGLIQSNHDEKCVRYARMGLETPPGSTETPIPSHSMVSPTYIVQEQFNREVIQGKLI